MARLKLDLEHDPSVTVIGISCHVHDHRLCWAMNRSMGLDLKRRRTDIMGSIGERTAFFSAFDHLDPATECRITLVQNHSPDGVLIKEQRNADFFMVVDNELAENSPGLLEQVRAVEFVLAAYPLPFELLREGHKLLEQTK